jgi:hypothetical protein
MNNDLMNLFEKIMREVVESLQCQDLCKDPKQCCDSREQCCPDPKQDNKDCCTTTCCQDVECGTLLHPKFYDSVRKELQDLNHRITGLMGYVHDQTCCKVEPLSCDILNDQLIAMLEYQLALTQRLAYWPRD